MKNQWMKIISAVLVSILVITISLVFLQKKPSPLPEKVEDLPLVNETPVDEDLFDKVDTIAEFGKPVLVEPFGSISEDKNIDIHFQSGSKLFISIQSYQVSESFGPESKTLELGSIDLFTGKYETLKKFDQEIRVLDYVKNMDGYILYSYYGAADEKGVDAGLVEINNGKEKILDIFKVKYPFQAPIFTMSHDSDIYYLKNEFSEDEHKVQYNLVQFNKVADLEHEILYDETCIVKPDGTEHNKAGSLCDFVGLWLSNDQESITFNTNSNNDTSKVHLFDSVGDLKSFDLPMNSKTSVYLKEREELIFSNIGMDGYDTDILKYDESSKNSRKIIAGSSFGRPKRVGEFIIFEPALVNDIGIMNPGRSEYQMIPYERMLIGFSKFYEADGRIFAIMSENDQVLMTEIILK